MRPTSIKAEQFGNCVKLSVKWRTKYLSGIVTEYLVFPDGTVSASLTCKNITPVNLPRYGLTFELTDGVDGIEYYGKGPHENYCDRKTAHVSESTASRVRRASFTITCSRRRTRTAVMSDGSRSAARGESPFPRRTLRSR